MADDEKKVEETTEETAAPEAAAEETKEEAPAKEEKKEEAKEEAPAEEAASDVDETVEVPKEFQKLVEQVEKMSVLELNELVKVLEKRFGVSASAVAVAGPAAGGDAGGEEQTEFTVELTEVGGGKIGVIKAVKEALGLGLKEAKDMVDGAPAVMKENMKKEDADALKAKMEEAGATVTLK
jgi:large subunit ribosomal protein L7/L12